MTIAVVLKSLYIQCILFQRVFQLKQLQLQISDITLNVSIATTNIVYGHYSATNIINKATGGLLGLTGRPLFFSLLLGREKKGSGPVPIPQLS